MANKMYIDPAHEPKRNYRLQGGDYEQGINKNPALHNKWLAHRDHITEKDFNENYFDPSKPKLSHRSVDDYRSKFGQQEPNPGCYYETFCEEHVKNQRPCTSSSKAKKAIEVRSVVKEPDSVMKRLIPKNYQPVREMPVPSKISLEKYEKNMASSLEMMKRKEKVAQMIETKKNKTVNFQNIPIPMKYQEMNACKSSGMSYEDYQYQQHCHEEDIVESSERDEVDSLYEDNEQFENDTQSEADSCCNEMPQIRESIEKLEKGRDYIFDMMNNTIINLKTHEKVAGNTSKKTDACAAGDSRSNQSGGALLRSDIVIKKIEAVKLDCYKKIENNLIRLKDIDDITNKLYQNYVDDAKN
ncbi:unnamed protein product [Diamesa serratosioi]